MSKDNGKKETDTIGGDNVIKFPKPPPLSRGSGKKDVEAGSRLTIHFEPDWDSDEDNPPDSTA
tara:strand:+ start:995 stop:1183 length:189 start_codon:yes stop_codon:yes gene_type:complete